MNDAFGIIFAYSDRRGMRELAEPRTTSSMPFAGRYRAVDFLLSNMVNASITDVGVIMREGYQSLIDHLGTGKDWELSRKIGGICLLPPYAYSYRDNLPGMGKLEALKQSEYYIKSRHRKYVVIGDANVIANIRLDDVFNAHIALGADITTVCADINGVPEMSIYYETNAEGRVKDIYYHPEIGYPLGSLGVFIMERSLLEYIIDYGSSRNMTSFENEAMRSLLDRLKVMAYVFKGYTSVLQTVESYFTDSMKLLDRSVCDELFNSDNPVYTRIRDEMPTYYGDEAKVSNSLVTDGCVIEGIVENSILFRGVTVSADAVVKDCILMQGTIVGEGARISNVITDKYVKISEYASLTGTEKFPVVINKGNSV